MEQMNVDSSFKMIDEEVDGASESSLKGHWVDAQLGGRMVESADERELELSTFVGCGGSDLGKRREEEGRGGRSGRGRGVGRKGEERA